jgi:hypothetical protein
VPCFTRLGGSILAHFRQSVGFDQISSCNATLWENYPERYRQGY